MITTTISKFEIVSRFEGCVSLREAIDRLEADFAKKGEVICEISINGVRLSEEDETNLAFSEFTGVEEIVVKTSRPFELIQEAATSATTFMTRLEAISLEASEAFRQEELDPAYKLFFSTADGLSSLIEMLVSIRRVIFQQAIPPQVVGPHRVLDENRWQLAEESFLDTTQELLEAFQRRDFILVADILEYDVPVSLRNWMDILALPQSEEGLLGQHSNSSKEQDPLVR